MEQQTNEMVVSLTERAASKVKSILEKENKPGFGLRLGVVHGGCSGYMYDINLEKSSNEGDIVFEDKGVKVFIESESMSFLKGSTVDYVESLQQSGFKVNNPNVKTTCGCGHSVG